MRRLYRLGAGAPFLLLPTLCGCGAPASPPTPVRGHIYYQGAPVPRGVIVFTPDAHRGGSGPLARAEIAADGSYELRSGETAGASAGWYRVTVIALADSAPVLSSGPFVVPRSLVPERYRDPELSGLVCEVKAGQENRLNFNLN